MPSGFAYRPQSTFSGAQAAPESYESPGWIRIPNICTSYLPTNGFALEDKLVACCLLALARALALVHRTAFGDLTLGTSYLGQSLARVDSKSCTRVLRRHRHVV